MPWASAFIGQASGYIVHNFIKDKWKLKSGKSFEYLFVSPSPLHILALAFTSFNVCSVQHTVWEWPGDKAVEFPNRGGATGWTHQYNTGKGWYTLCIFVLVVGQMQVQLRVTRFYWHYKYLCLK